MASGRHLLMLCVCCSALAFTPRGATAQTIVRPHASALWVAVPSDPGAAATRPVGTAQARGALIGGVVGAVVGGIAGHAICRRFGSNSTDGCTGDTLWWGALGGALGLLIGASAGHEADQ